MTELAVVPDPSVFLQELPSVLSAWTPPLGLMGRRVCLLTRVTPLGGEGDPLIYIEQGTIRPTTDFVVGELSVPGVVVTDATFQRGRDLRPGTRVPREVEALTRPLAQGSNTWLLPTLADRPQIGRSDQDFILRWRSRQAKPKEEAVRWARNLFLVTKEIPLADAA